MRRPEENESESKYVCSKMMCRLPNVGLDLNVDCRQSFVEGLGDWHHHREGQALPLSSTVSCLTSPPIAIILPGMSPCPSNTPSQNQFHVNGPLMRLLFSSRISMKTFHCQGIFWSVSTTMILLWLHRLNVKGR